VRAALLLSLLAAGCTPKTPADVADRFVDLYFVEIDQKRALAYSTGLAHGKLEEELGLVEKVRQEMTPDLKKPSVFYVRRDLQVDGARARATYDITVRQGRDETLRSALVSLEEEGGRWTVGNFIVREGHLTAKPPAAPPKSP
jgi:hypothetical protein